MLYWQGKNKLAVQKNSTEQMTIIHFKGIRPKSPELEFNTQQSRNKIGINTNPRLLNNQRGL